MWSPRDVKRFWQALDEFGKHYIDVSRFVKTKTVAQCVCYYYDEHKFAVKAKAAAERAVVAAKRAKVTVRAVPPLSVAPVRVPAACSSLPEAASEDDVIVDVVDIIDLCSSPFLDIETLDHRSDIDNRVPIVFARLPSTGSHAGAGANSGIAVPVPSSWSRSSVLLNSTVFPAASTDAIDSGYSSGESIDVCGDGMQVSPSGAKCCSV